jgi:MFS family permease
VTDVQRVVAGRTIRGFADGFVSVLLARYLTDLGFSPLQVGVVVTGTLLGSAALTLVFGVRARHTTLGHLLVAACLLMFATGLGFGLVTAFVPLLLVAVVGTLNPSAGDVSVFLPSEQAFIADRVEGRARTRSYAVYNLAGTLAGAVGALASGVPGWLAERSGWSVVTVQRFGFGFYALSAVAILALYRTLPRRGPSAPSPAPVPAAEGRRVPRRIVFELAALFSLDSAGSGFVVTSLLVLWLDLRFDMSRAQTAGVFFAAGLLGAASQLLAPVLARRVGLIRTMVFTHLPANALLALAAFAPNGTVAVVLLLTRALFAQMDVPARQAFVMAVVPPADRAMASSVTNVPRSLASATTPLLAGALLSRSTFGWPLLIAGTTKFAYDLLLLALHRDTPEAEA